jgi:hypothetical protein
MDGADRTVTSRTRYKRARQAAQARRHVIPLAASFFLGFAAARACYPFIRRLFLTGALAPLKISVLEAHRTPRPWRELSGAPLDWLWAAPMLAAALVSVWCVVEEERRRSVAKSLLRNRVYRIGVAAFAASLVVPWVRMGEMGRAATDALVALAACAVVGAAWPVWRQATRMQALALFIGGSGLAILIAYYIDSLVLRG